MRTCPNCGHMLSEKDTICFKCGMQLSQIEKPRGSSIPPQMMFNQKNNNKGIPSGPKKIDDDKAKTIYIVLGAVVVLALLAVIMVFVSKNNRVDDKPPEIEAPSVVLKPGDEDEDPEDPKKVIEPEKPTPTTPTTPTTPSGPTTHTPTGESATAGANEHVVNNNGYSYAIPNEYIEKDMGTKGVHLINYKKTKQMLIGISLGSIANLKERFPALQSMYTDAGAVVHRIESRTIEGIEVICVELTKNGQNMIIGITDAAEREIFAINVYNSSTNAVDYELLAEGVRIIKTAVKVGSTVAA